MKVALSIAGSDPTGGAGLQLDVQVFRHFGVHGAAVPTALTVQDTRGVAQVLPLFPNVVLEQLRRLLADLRPDAIKIGMLATDDVARNVALALSGVDASIPWVIDPVLASSDGTPLLEARAHGTLASLFSRAVLVTPNRPEAASLSGEDTSTDRGAERAAERLLRDDGARAVLLKGGHREGAPRDLLAHLRDDALVATWLEGERDAGPPVHGTGCALSAAIAAALAKGDGLEEAVRRGREFTRTAIRAAWARGGGARLLGF